jgi:signal transduction histidine kinase
MEQRFYNPPRDLIYERPGSDPEPGQMVALALARDDICVRGDRLAGPLRMFGEDWGGYYLMLKEMQGPRGSTAPPPPISRSILLILLLLVPGLMLLFAFTWRLIFRRLVEPVERLGAVALSVGRGDYSQRLDVPEGKDEVTRVILAFNRMLSLIEEYSQELEARVEDAALEIERKNRELMLGQRLAATGTLAAGIAHEINNPLGGMLNVARRLQREDLTQEQRARYIRTLEEGIERIGAIVRKVLAVSPRKMTPSPLDLAEVLQRTVDLVGHRAQELGVEVIMNLQADLPPILGEANEIGQVFLNLLINAIDACESGQGRVEVTLTREGGTLVVEIEDDGVGMPPEIAERAFDMFFTTKDAGKGTGLGLATVHSLVQSHGGTLTFDTRVDDGTCFRVALPIMEAGPRERGVR